MVKSFFHYYSKKDIASAKGDLCLFYMVKSGIIDSKIITSHRQTGIYTMEEKTMRIEKGCLNDIDGLECLYNDLNDYLETHINFPGWKKGIYPVKETALKGIEEGDLFVIKNDKHIVGSVILRHEPELAYYRANWKIELEYKDIFVVYTFAVHPLYLKQGVGKAMMDFVIQYSKDKNIKAVRLDVYEKNTPAICLYKKYGFQYIDTVDLGYSEYGLDKFELYQKLL